MLGIIGTKIGMTRIFSEAGVSTPVTVIHAPANHVSQIKSTDKDGYSALQVSAGTRKHPSKAQTAHFKKSGAPVGKVIREFRINEDEMRELGETIGVDAFNVGQGVNVTGITKGKGFAGGIKRHHFNALDMSHGNSLAHRSIGSTGQCQEPGKVFKGKKMPGQLGAVQATVRNLKVVEVDKDNELLLISGAVPGSRGQMVVVKSLDALIKKSEEDAPTEVAEPVEAKGDDSADNKDKAAEPVEAKDKAAEPVEANDKAAEPVEAKDDDNADKVAEPAEAAEPAEVAEPAEAKGDDNADNEAKDKTAEPAEAKTDDNAGNEDKGDTATDDGDDAKDKKAE